MSHDKDASMIKPSRRDILRAGAASGLGIAGWSGLTMSGEALMAVSAQAATGQLVLGVTQEAVNFNPLLYVNTGVETSVEFIVFDQLWKIDDKGAFVPNLAAEIPTAANGGISADGLTWTIKLR